MDLSLFADTILSQRPYSVVQSNKFTINSIKFGKYTHKTMMGRKDKNSHTGRVPKTAAVLPRWIVFVLGNEKSGDPPIQI